MAHPRYLLAMVLLLLSAGSAFAEGPRGISVTGEGQAKAKANVAEIVAHVRGVGKSAAEALGKYRKAKADLLKAMMGLKIEALSVSGMGLRIQSETPNKQMAMMMAAGGGGGAAKVETTIHVSEQIRLSLRGIDKMTAQALSDTLVKLIDLGRKAGMVLDSGSGANVFMQRGQLSKLVTFKLSNPEALRGVAFKAAMKQARQRALRLAELSGVRIGGLHALTEGSAAKKNLDPQMMMLQRMWGAQGTTDSGSSALMTDITIKVKLSVIYRILQ